MKLLVLILTFMEFGHTIETRDSTCVVSQLQDLERITQSCHNITIRDLFVPAGETLVLDLLNGATVTFLGKVDFAFLNWSGPLMRVYGNAIIINGAPGNTSNTLGALLNCFSIKGTVLMAKANCTGTLLEVGARKNPNSSLRK